MLSCIIVHFMKSTLAFCRLALSYPSRMPTLLVFCRQLTECLYSEVLITPLLIQISQPSFLFCSLVFKFKLPGSVCLPAPHSPSITLASQLPHGSFYSEDPLGAAAVSRIHTFSFVCSHSVTSHMERRVL